MKHYEHLEVQKQSAIYQLIRLRIAEDICCRVYRTGLQFLEYTRLVYSSFLRYNQSWIHLN